MPYYNLTNITGSNSTVGLATAVNDLSGGWLGVTLLIVIFMIFFIALKNYPRKEAFGAATLITFISALLLWTLEWISDFALFVCVIAAALAIVALIHNRD